MHGVGIPMGIPDDAKVGLLTSQRASLSAGDFCEPDPPRASYTPTHLRVGSPQRLPILPAWRPIHGRLVMVQRHRVRLAESGDPFVLAEHPTVRLLERQATINLVAIPAFIIDSFEVVRPFP